MDGGFAHVKLCRAEKMNALDRPLLEALVETGRELAEDTALRAVLMSGEGRVFCAGLDMDLNTDILTGDRKRVGSGKSVTVRVDLGGRSIIKKNKQSENL